jgi:hypothetical protein
MSKEDCSKLIAELKTFMVQATSGVLVFLLRLNQDNITSGMLEGYLRMYLNTCWHSFGNKRDEYVVVAFDKILSFGIIKGSVCLLHWMMKIGEVMINMIDLEASLKNLSSLKTISEKRYTIYSNMNIIFDIISPDFKGLQCDGDSCCNNEYDGLNIF